MNRTFRFALASIALASLAACGGGGGGDSAPTAPSPTPVTSAPVTPVGPTAVRLTGLSIKSGDILAQTTNSTTFLASVVDFFKRSAFDIMPTSTAFANGKDKIKPGNNFGFTNKVENGKLVNLGVKLKNADGTDTECDTSTAEVKLHKVWGINPGKGHLMTKADAPAFVNPDCTVEYRTGMYVVTDAGSAIELPTQDDSIVQIIEAGDQASNTSDRALIIYASGTIRTLTVTEQGTAVLQDLNAQGIQLDLTRPNTLAFDGTHLVALPTGRPNAALVFNVKDSSFKIISTEMPETPSDLTRPTGYPPSVMLDDQGRFVWYEYDQFARELDIEQGVYRLWKPAQANMVKVDEGMEVNSKPFGRYGVRGRDGKWVMSDRCILWNYETDEFYAMQAPEVRPNIDPSGWSLAASMGATHAAVSNGVAHCINHSGNIFTEVDLVNRKVAHFDTDQMGIFFSAGRKVEMVKGKAMLWGAVSTANSDIKIVELNFEQGAMIDHGTVAVGSRKVVELVPIN